MKKIFLDTNILIDLIVERQPHLTTLQETLPYLNPSQIYLSTLSIHIIYYVLKIKKDSKLDKRVQTVCSKINLVPLTPSITLQAINTYLTDFEDTLQYYSALDQDCDYILTRNIKDFNKLKKQISSDTQIVDTLEGIL